MKLGSPIVLCMHKHVKPVSRLNIKMYSARLESRRSSGTKGAGDEAGQNDEEGHDNHRRIQIAASIETADGWHSL